jgi:hypothetical protein
VSVFVLKRKAARRLALQRSDNPPEGPADTRQGSIPPALPSTVIPRDPLPDEKEKNAEEPKGKSRSAAERAEHFSDHLLKKCYADIEILRAEVASHVKKCDALLLENRALQDVRVELAGLKSPRHLLKGLTGVWAFATGVGTAAVAKFPQDANIAFWNLTNSACFGTGIALLLVAAVLAGVIAYLS